MTSGHLKRSGIDLYMIFESDLLYIQEEDKQGQKEHDVENLIIQEYNSIQNYRI